MGNDDGAKCDCGHFKNEHQWILKETGFWEEHWDDFTHSTGKCKKCLCEKYDHPRRFIASESIKYPERIIKNDDSEKRCTRCGCLLSNHVDVGHPFQDAKTLQE
ncbi:MAG: hypothetical protein OEL52_05260 [Nitrosopumilus sp.]|nr:hypothetical protein [Nitrosopumilus sp.]